jgi:hypothetical protein
VIKWSYLKYPFRLFVAYLILSSLTQLMSYLEISTEQIIFFQYASLYVNILVLTRMIAELQNYSVGRYSYSYSVVLLFIFCLDYGVQWDKVIKYPFAFILSNLIFIFLSIGYLAKELTRSIFNRETIASLLLVSSLITEYILFDFLQLLNIALYSNATKTLLQNAHYIFWVFIVLCYVIHSFVLLWAPRKEKFI